MTFEFRKPTAVQLQHLNVRTEKHGDDNATALDLKFVRTASNDILDMLHPKLREAFFYRSDATEAQDEIAGVEKILPNLQFPKLGTLAWELEHTGCRVVICFGLGGASDIILNDCKVNQFRIDMAEGGSTTLTWRVQTSSIPDGALDKLSKQLQGEIEIMLELPDAGVEKAAPGAQLTIDGTAGPKANSSTVNWPFPKKAAPADAPAPDATATFVAQHGAANEAAPKSRRGAAKAAH